MFERALLLLPDGRAVAHWGSRWASDAAIASEEASRERSNCEGDSRQGSVCEGCSSGGVEGSSCKESNLGQPAAPNAPTAGEVGGRLWQPAAAPKQTCSGGAHCGNFTAPAEAEAAERGERGVCSSWAPRARFLFARRRLSRG